MREIKFRGKRVDNGEWIVEYLFVGREATYILCKKSPAEKDSQGLQPFKPNPVIPETVGQFTGLCDKNGKEIFEGDIMKTELFTKYFQITFGNSEKWGAAFCHQSHNSIYFLNKNFTDTSEVIGNIYSNPDLLR